MPKFDMDQKETFESLATATVVENGTSSQKGTPYLRVYFDLDETLPDGKAQCAKTFWLTDKVKEDEKALERIRYQLSLVGINYKLLQPEQWDDDDYLTRLASGKRARTTCEKSKDYGWQVAWINPVSKPKKGAAAALLGVGATLFPAEPASALVPAPPPEFHAEDDDVPF